MVERVIRGRYVDRSDTKVKQNVNSLNSVVENKESEVKTISSKIEYDEIDNIIEPVSVVLKGVADEAFISKHLASIGSLETTPLAELVLVHNKLADFNDSIEKLSDSSTGAQLKEALSKHDFETQIVLLAGYIKAKKVELDKINSEWPNVDRRKVNTVYDSPDRRTEKKDSPTTDDESGIEEIKLKLKTKAIMSNGLILIVILISIFATLALTSASTGLDGTIIKSILDAAVVVMKTIFG